MLLMLMDRMRSKQVYHYSPDALWDALIPLNSTFYMYLDLLLKYNARVARQVRQLMRRMSSNP
jgi:hypothetical protein